MPLDDLLVALGALVSADPKKAKEIATAMRGHADTAAIAQELVNFGAGKKKSEMDADVARLTRTVSDLTAEKEAVEAELAELKAKQPDLAALEQRLTAKHTAALRAKDEVIAEKDRTLKGALIARAREKFISALVSAHRVDPEYAREVAAAKHSDRFKANDDGSMSVLQLGSSETIDADTEDAAITTLAAAVSKHIPARYVLSGTDSGGGTRSGQGGGNVAGADQARAAKELQHQYGAL